MMGHNRLTKFALVSFPQKFSFNTIVQFEQAIMSHNLLSKNFEIFWYNSYTKVTVNLPKKPLSGQGQIGPILGQNDATLCLMIHCLSIFLKFCGMMRHKIDRQKVALVILPKFKKNTIMTWCDI